jgi:hypothetical protein
VVVVHLLELVSTIQAERQARLEATDPAATAAEAPGKVAHRLLEAQ